MTTYKGKKINGTSTEQTVYKDSGVGSAAVGDHYLNVKTGRYYECKKAGKPKDAKWVYVETRILEAPSVGVESLKLVRKPKGSRKMAATWSLPDKLFDKGSCSRATGIYETWKFDTSNPSTGKTNKDSADIRDLEVVAGKDTSAVENLDDFEVIGKIDGHVWTRRQFKRKDFWPLTKRKLQSLTVVITPYNKTQAGEVQRASGKAVKSATFKFKTPRVPKLSLAFNASNGKMETAVETDPGEDAQERYDTEYKRTVYRYVGGSKSTTVTHSSSTAKKISLTVDVSGWQLLQPGEYIIHTLTARARGFAGDSNWATEKRKTISIPKTPSVKSISVDGTDSGGRTRVMVNIPAENYFPVTNIRLEKLVGVEFTKASQITAQALIDAGKAWESTDAVDNGNCNALAIDTSELTPERGLRTWVRIKAWNTVESLHSYSEPVEAKELYRAPAPTPSAEDNACSVQKCTKAGDGAMWVYVAWDKKNSSTDNDSDGVQLAWSDDKDALHSTEEPQTFEVTFADQAADTTWNKRAKVKVKGLDEGTRYYFWARCFTNGEDGDTYGPWCSPVDGTTQTAAAEPGDEDVEIEPPTVTLTAPNAVEAGKPIPLMWVVASERPQESWRVEAGGKVLASGDNDSGAVTLTAEQAERGIADGSLTCTVTVMAGGVSGKSGAVTVLVSERPTLSLRLEELTAQPCEIDMETDAPGRTVALAVRHESGTVGETVDGSVGGLVGDTIWSGVVSPTWALVTWENSVMYANLVAAEEEAQEKLAETLEALEGLEPGDDDYDELMSRAEAAQDEVDEAAAAIEAGAPGPLYKATATLPGRLALVDGLRYRADATATDTATGLKSDVMSALFDVDWARKAVTPGDEVTVEPDVVEPQGTGGDPSRLVVITLAETDGMDDADVYDVYRLTHDGAYRISPEAGFPSGHVATDLFAPYIDFGECVYRIAVRTPDGSVAWRDYSYVLQGEMLRIDWNGRSVELPWQVEVDDAFEKDFEARTHLDGTTDGYWNRGVKRTAAIEAMMLRPFDKADDEALRAIGQYAGPVFVRTPNGSAYQANVSVDGLGAKNKNPLGTVSLSATEVELGASYMLPTVQDNPGEEQGEDDGE